MSFVTPKEAAEILDLSFGYVQYLRTDLAKSKGHIGPPWYMVDLRDGSANPKRVKYKRKDLEAWMAEREEQRAQLPQITRHTNRG